MHRSDDGQSLGRRRSLREGEGLLVRRPETDAASGLAEEGIGLDEFDLSVASVDLCL